MGERSVARLLREQLVRFLNDDSGIFLHIIHVEFRAVEQLSKEGQRGRLIRGVPQRRVVFEHARMIGGFAGRGQEEFSGGPTSGKS